MIRKVQLPPVNEEVLRKMEELCCCAEINCSSAEKISKMTPVQILDVLVEKPLITYKKIGNMWERVGESSYKMNYKKG